jgi:hypothetical protein
MRSHRCVFILARTYIPFEKFESFTQSKSYFQVESLLTTLCDTTSIMEFELKVSILKCKLFFNAIIISNFIFFLLGDEDLLLILNLLLSNVFYYFPSFC